MGTQAGMLAQLFERSMGLGPEWEVSDVWFEERGDAPDKLHVRVAHMRGQAVECTECGRRCGTYDARERTWPHLDIWQYETIVHCAVPRADCPEHGVRTVRMPWEVRPNSHFTALFEAQVLVMALSGMTAAATAPTSSRSPGTWPRPTQNLNELHAEFGKLSVVYQGYAQTLIQDIQAGEAEMHPGWTMRDYLNAYKTSTEEGNISRLVEVTGIDEERLRELMRLHLTRGNLNAHGHFDELRTTANLGVARDYFIKATGAHLSDRVINKYIDTLLRDFLITGGFDVDEYAQALVKGQA